MAPKNAKTTTVLAASTTLGTSQDGGNGAPDAAAALEAQTPALADNQSLSTPTIAAATIANATEETGMGSSTSGAASGTISVDPPESEAANGEAGNVASLAEQPSWMRGVSAALDDAIAEFTKNFPRLAALIQSSTENGHSVSAIRVTSSIDQLRRGGIRHPLGASEYPPDSFDPDQVEAMLGEQALTVELI
jgi:hypothetical protein